MDACVGGEEVDASPLDALIQNKVKAMQRELGEEGEEGEEGAGALGEALRFDALGAFLHLAAFVRRSRRGESARSCHAIALYTAPDTAPDTAFDTALDTALVALCAWCDDRGRLEAMLVGLFCHCSRSLLPL